MNKTKLTAEQIEEINAQALEADENHFGCSPHSDIIRRSLEYQAKGREILTKPLEDSDNPIEDMKEKKKE